jgi:para-aminobenzoate synthetase component I
MTGIEVRIRPVDLPHGPQGTMAVLRRGGRHALLHSSLMMPGQAEWSFIAGPARATLYTDARGTRLQRDGIDERRWDDPFDAIRWLADEAGTALRIDGERPHGMGFAGGWVGVLGYDLARHCHRLPSQAAADPALPTMWWMAVDEVLAFHHPSGRWWHSTVSGPADRWPWSRARGAAAGSDTLARAAQALPPPRPWRAGVPRQRMDRVRFERGVGHIRAAIAAGEVLQVNLTRRDDMAFEGDPWSLYEDLVEANPAPFSAYIEAPGFALASASPERFLRLRGGEVQARPIKGTATRGTGVAQDAIQRQWLAASEKNRAENLMITDLMRNDLGRVSRIGSMRVPELFALEPYASVWQMVSTIESRLAPGCGAADLLRACWPPGSMTGAPKQKAMEIIERLEPLRRGLYAGAIGYLDCSGDMDLSVVIRSAVIAQGRAMVQVGGGIVADSDPAEEWDETLAKGERLMRVLAGAPRSGPSEAANPPVLPSR